MSRLVPTAPIGSVTEPADEARLPLLDRFQGLWISVVLVVAIIFFALVIPGFRFVNSTNLANITLDASQILILSVATTFILIAAGIDLSIGAIVVLASVVAASAMARFSGTPAEVTSFQFPQAHVGIPIGIAAALVTGLVCGFLNGLIITRLRITPFIVTLGTLGIYSGLAMVLAGGKNQVYIPPGLQQSVGVARLGGVVPVPVVIALVIAAIGWIILVKTRFGVYTFAIGASEEAARLAGINVRRHLLVLYTISGLAAGISGVIDVARFSTTSIEAHTTDNLQAIAAVVIGGTSLFGGIGGMGGSIIGSLFPSTLKNGFIQMGVEPFWQPVVIGIVLIIAVTYDTFRRSRA